MKPNFPLFYLNQPSSYKTLLAVTELHKSDVLLQINYNMKIFFVDTKTTFPEMSFVVLTYTHKHFCKLNFKRQKIRLLMALFMKSCSRCLCPKRVTSSPCSIRFLRLPACLPATLQPTAHTRVGKIARPLSRLKGMRQIYSKLRVLSSD